MRPGDSPEPGRGYPAFTNSFVQEFSEAPAKMRYWKPLVSVGRQTGWAVAPRQSLTWFSCLLQTTCCMEDQGGHRRLCHSLIYFLSLWLACPGHFVCTLGRCAAWPTRIRAARGASCRTRWDSAAPVAFCLDGVPCPSRRAPSTQPHLQHSCPGEPTSSGSGPTVAECGPTPVLSAPPWRSPERPPLVLLGISRLCCPLLRACALGSMSKRVSIFH